MYTNVEIGKYVDQYLKQMKMPMAVIRTLIGSSPIDVAPGRDVLNEVVDRVLTSAAKAALDAGYAGEHGDNGASATVKQLKCFIDGIQYAVSGHSDVYGTVIEQIERESNPEYQEYLRLKEKFGDK